ncbi:MAG: hypothetical protein JXX29_17035 [Deltaproteobacteria bacterium]|nr:hypothetical protein [Deltaproteobacteria bacterium]MBN2673392.1 hypothetical protein [Deltaproteobacteria bacterium]
MNRDTFFLIRLPASMLTWVTAALLLTAGSCSRTSDVDEDSETEPRISASTDDTAVSTDTGGDTTQSDTSDSSQHSENNLTEAQVAFYALNIAEVQNDLYALAEWFCANTGGMYYLNQSVPVNPHQCILSDGTVCDMVQYYIGQCAPEKSVCSRLGYEFIVEENVDNPYHHQFWMSCMVDGEKVSVFEFINQH